MEGTKKCPYCGGEIMTTAKKCKHCKQWLNEKQPNELGATDSLTQLEKKEEPASVQELKQPTQSAPQIIYVQPTNNLEESSVEKPKSIREVWGEWPEWAQWLILWIIGMFGFFIFKLITGGL